MLHYFFINIRHKRRKSADLFGVVERKLYFCTPTYLNDGIVLIPYQAIMKRLIILFLCILMFLPLMAKEQKDVLVVCSFPLSGTWAKNTISPITELDTDKSKMNIHYSIMRNSSFKSVEEYEIQENTIFEYYDDKRPDFILIFGPGNYILAEDFNKKWKDVPMLLVGELNYVCNKEYVCDSIPLQDVERIPMRDFAKGKNMTFLHTPVFLEELTDLICLVNPQVRTINFYGGEEFLSRELEMSMLWATKAFGKNFKAYHPDDINYSGLKTLLEKTDKETSAFVYCNWHNKEGIADKSLPSDGLRSSLVQMVPLFNVYYSTIEKDDPLVGFVSYNHEEYKSEIQEMFLKIVNNQRAPRDIPFVELNKDKPILNYNALVKMGYHKDNLPSGTIICNLPPSFWDKYVLPISLHVIIFLSIISVFFFHLYKRQKRMKEELKEAKEKAEESERMKTAFIDTVSHEIRTPLNAVIGFSQLLALPDFEITQEEKEQYAQYITNNSEMLMMLVNDILNVSNIENGQMVVSITDVVCNEVCRKAMSISESRLPDGVKLRFTTDVHDEFTIQSDEKRIQQVLINYLINSCKHTEKGEIHLHCSLTENPGKITFSVADTGTGVPAEMAEKVFERFTKLDLHKQGVGLGLSICRDIAGLLNGEVNLDTSYTDGARFVFILPIAN